MKKRHFKIFCSNSYIFFIFWFSSWHTFKFKYISWQQITNIKIFKQFIQFAKSFKNNDRDFCAIEITINVTISNLQRVKNRFHQKTNFIFLYSTKRNDDFNQRYKNCKKILMIVITLYLRTNNRKILTKNMYFVDI